MDGHGNRTSTSDATHARAHARDTDVGADSLDIPVFLSQWPGGIGEEPHFGDHA